MSTVDDFLQKLTPDEDKSIIDSRTKNTTALLSLYNASKIAEMASGSSLGVLTPELMLGPIPIYNVEDIGHASSDELLKYRSMSGIFLAHQKGGNKTFKFRGKIFGPMRYVYYSLLEALQQNGIEEMMELGNLAKKRVNISDGILDADMNRDMTLNTDERPSSENRGTLYNYQPHGELSEQKYPYHKTFPIITDTRIYMFMYIETLRMEQNIKFGKDVIEIDVLCRHYLPPTNYNYAEEEPSEDEDEEEFVGKRYYRTYSDSRTMKRFKDRLTMLNMANIGFQITRESILSGIANDPEQTITDLLK